MSYSSFGQETHTVNAQATITSAGGDVKVLYAGSPIPEEPQEVRIERRHIFSSKYPRQLSQIAIDTMVVNRAQIASDIVSILTIVYIKSCTKGN
ncbi:MAG: hypothetical protein M3P08_16720 [Thermoproteota archaeon]|nr:hypothetical protein [Thermoproteota archaeon]